MAEKVKRHVEKLGNGELIYRSSMLCLAKDIGVHSNLFGGNMLAKIDEIGATLSCEICDTPRMVTKKMEEVIFDHPVKVGHIIKFYGGIENIGNTSIALNIEARRYNVYTEKEVVVCSTKMIFVRIDEDGNPIPISQRIKDRYSKQTKSNPTRK
jgi:acyl-CoA thioesterase YciA